MFRSIAITFIAICTTQVCNAQEVQWLTWEDAFAKSETEPRKYIVDIYTEWCGWCKKMDKTTFSDPVIIDYINAHYYPIKFDAQYKGEIEYRGTVYDYQTGIKGGYHQLAAKITGQRLKLPTVVFLAEDTDILQAIPGYQNSATFEMIMTYFAEDQNRVTPWRVFTANYKNRKLRTGQIENDSSHTRTVSNNRRN